jgi:methylated-DNA-protein-cysteine methyltransferase-like protein
VSAAPDNYRKIWNTVARIPRGRVASYGQIADLAGLPRRARLVGTALHNTPNELELPWHRVLRADGRLAFPTGSEAFAEQRARLIEESVSVKYGRVDLRQFGWQDSLDALLWGPDGLD